MEKVEQQVRRLDALVTDLLAFSRPSEPRVAPVRLEEVARGVVELVQRDNPGVVLKATGMGGARADQNLVHQILLNLVLNAVQALDGPGRVDVIISDGRVIINDDGPGIPVENLDRIFQPFFTTRTRGTGLGLAISRKAATSMGGRITLGHGPLAGAAFVLELPTA
jgi:signal transduction histidine kinase